MAEVEGVKYDSGKPEYSLVPFEALDEVVKVLTVGAKKYAPDNWKKVEPYRERYSSAALRHISAYMSGEPKDGETGLPHLAHAVCCLLFLIWKDKQKEGK